MIDLRRTGLLAIFFLWIFAIQAQISKTLPTEPAEFLKEFRNRVTMVDKTKDTDEWLKKFEEDWTLGKFTVNEQERFINHVNIMLLKNFSMVPEVLSYATVFHVLKDPASYVQLPVGDFFEVTDSCILTLDRKLVGTYFKFLYVYIKDGSAFKTSGASWHLSQKVPHLQFVRETNQETGQSFVFPILDFSTTDLIFKSKTDSTKITSTRGRLNLINRVFRADGGRITWEKMKLDPSSVYCDLQDYTLNLNYQFVKIDTVTFYYKGLIDKPLKGSYEDLNKGYADINKANYPYFRSYEGGVVIKNLIPNATYEGGFSLKGIKKIGSAYYKQVKEEYKQDSTEAPQPDQYFDFWVPDSTVTQPEETITEEQPTDTTAGGEEVAPFDLPSYNEYTVLVKARISIMRGEQELCRLQAYEFVLDLEKLTSSRTEATLYMANNDTIWHPSLEVLYEVEGDVIYLFEDVKNKYSRQGFTSSYHKYYLQFDAIKWYRKIDSLSFTSIIDKPNKISAIESEDFYKKDRFDNYKGVLKFNPITGIYYYAMEHPNTEIYAEHVLDFLKVPSQSNEFSLACEALKFSGFIDFDKTIGLITPKEKLYTWAKAARNKKDYDAIQIISQVDSGHNATLDLNTKEMLLNGVTLFSLSDSQLVRVVPHENEVFVQRDRNLEFGGIMAGGKLNFYGDGSRMFKFDYENYKVTCDSLDSLRFILVRNPPPGFTFSPLQIALRNTSIEGVTGAVYINKPNNKNGLEPHPEYPVFDSYTQSYVYWAKSGIKGGVYKKDKLYFSLDPFVLDSLETFNERSITFEGEFYCSEIFPKFRQKLAVMPDYTLGFVETTPDTGYPSYEGKGNYTGDIILDGSGLHGIGQMDFLSTTAKSDTFEFYFDSVKAVTKEFYMPEGDRNGVHYPEIKADQIKYTWLTKKDEVELETVDMPITLFKGEGTFLGKIKITKEGVFGNGTVTLGEVSITSENISLNTMDFTAKDAVFKVADKNDPTKFHFIAEKVLLDYNVTDHHASFSSSQTGVANSSFPIHNYKTSLGKGEYDKETGNIKLESSSSYLKNNFFYTTDPNQDSLNFYAKTAFYNVDERQVHVSGVPYIYVADAKITPDSLRLSIKSDGYIQQLENALIDANLITKYHKMYDAKVDITSAQNYTATAKYDYKYMGGPPQYISLTTIKVRQDTTTIATGVIPPEQKFFLTEKILFSGKTELQADQKFMQFTGEVQIQSKNPALQNKIKFDEIVNPDSVFIRINDPNKDAKGNILLAGLEFTPQNRQFYSLFVQPLKDVKKDIPVTNATGGLTYDLGNNVFKIGPQLKLVQKQYRGAVVSYDDSLNIITTEGLINFPYHMEKGAASVVMSGLWKDDIDRKEVTGNLVMGFDMSIIPKEAWAKLSQTFLALTAGGTDVDFQDRKLQEYLSELLDKGEEDEKNTQKFVSSISSAVVYTDVKVAAMLPSNSILLSGAKFGYHNEYKSLHAEGQMGLLGIGGNSINKQVTGKVEYSIGKQTSSGIFMNDTVNIYLETDQENWMYFQICGNLVLVASSDEQGFNTVLAEILAKKKDKGDEKTYRFEIVTPMEKDAYLSRYAKRYIFTD